MAIITLTSDWGIKSHYVSSVKGSILRNIPNANIIDISHSVSPFNIMEASFVLKNAVSNFPPGSIHLIGINSEAGIETPHTAVFAEESYFIGADNGIFSLLFDNIASIEAVELDVKQKTDYFTFSTRDVFILAVKMIVEGKKLKDIGVPRKELTQRIPFKPVIYPDRIIGKVIYVDDYENVFINIDQDTFKSVAKARPFSISFKSYDSEITKICAAYTDVVPGEKLALFGTTGYMEIAINQGNASSLLGLAQNDSVVIEFYNKE